MTPACTVERPCDSPHEAVAGASLRGRTDGGREPVALPLLHDFEAGSASAIALAALVDALAEIVSSAEPGCCARCPSPSRTCWKVKWLKSACASNSIATPPSFANFGIRSLRCVVTNLDVTWWPEKTQVTE